MKRKSASVLFGLIATCTIFTTSALAGNVGTADIIDGAVTAPKLANSAVTTQSVLDSAITSAKIADSSVTNQKIDDNAVTTAKIADGNITTAKIANGSITNEKISGPISASKISPVGLDADTLDGIHASEMSPLVHTHSMADLNGLQGALASKSDIGHSHSEFQNKYANVIIVAKSGGDFTNPRDALNSITDASVTNNYLIKVMPGTYDIGANYFMLRPYIDVLGEGVDISKIITHSNTGFLTALNSSFRNLTLETKGFPDPTTFAYGLSAPPQGNATIRDLKVVVSGHDNSNIAVFAQTGSQNIVVENVTAIASSDTGTNYGIQSEGTDITIRNSKAIANGQGSNVAICLKGQWYDYANTKFKLINVESYSVNGNALYTDFANVEVFSSILEVDGQTALSLNRGGVVQIDGSVIKTNATAVISGIDQLFIANTKMFGPVINSTNIRCLNAYNQNYVQLNSLCQ